MRAFADALDCIPMALAENSGLSPIETLANIKSRQAKEKNTRLGVDCMQTGSNGKSTTFSSPRYLKIFSAFIPGRSPRFLSYQRDILSSVFTAIKRIYIAKSLRGCAVPWCIQLPAASASVGCSAMPPRVIHSLRASEHNHKWR